MSFWLMLPRAGRGAAQRNRLIFSIGDFGNLVSAPPGCCIFAVADWATGVAARADAWRRPLAANAAGSMIGVPRHGDIDSRSVSFETMMSGSRAGLAANRMLGARRTV
jgi:hypothetical protein